MSSPADGSDEQDCNQGLRRIAVGVDGFPEGQDAVSLGAMLARATDAELMLVAVHPTPLVILPGEFSWKSLDDLARETLREARQSFAPEARILVETDISVARALHRVVARERRDVLVMGSSRQAPQGAVRIGKRTRQLLCHFECALAIAPRGMHERARQELRTIGVGFDGGPESEAALALAGQVAAGAGAELRMLGVVDDRMPSLGWSHLWIREVAADWHEVVADEISALRERAVEAARAAQTDVKVEVRTGRPADALRELASEVDLLVIGSRRWGPVARVLLGATGEALLHDVSCPMLVVPRPVP